MKLNYIRIGVLGLALLFGAFNQATVGAVTSKKTTPETVPLSGGFSEGYRAGYKRAHPMGIPPIPPIPPIGKNNYEDGFGMGYAQGILDKR